MADRESFSLGHDFFCAWSAARVGRYVGTRLMDEAFAVMSSAAKQKGPRTRVAPDVCH